MKEKEIVSFADLLQTATTDPGTISSAYGAFHNYSLGNQILAMMQCKMRQLPIGPLSTFQHWKELGRHVKRGERALSLIMPVTCKRRDDAGAEVITDDGEPQTFTRFICVPRWFVLSQTDGADHQPQTVAGWDNSQALAALNITEKPYALADGNCQGYARPQNREIALNPLCQHQQRTRFHEIAHVMLHAENEMDRAEKELEA